MHGLMCDIGHERLRSCGRISREENDFLSNKEETLFKVCLVQVIFKFLQNVSLCLFFYTPKSFNITSFCKNTFKSS